MSERMLGGEEGYEISLLWIPGKEDDASVCITGPGMTTVHIPYAKWRAFSSAVQRAWVTELFSGDRLFEEDEE